MKKLLVVVVLLMAVSAATFAQPTITNSNTLATATVVGAWTLNQLTNLTFGNVYSGGTYVVAANVGTSGSLAFVGANATTQVDVTFPTAGGLTGPGTAIPFASGTIRTNTVAAAGTSTAYTVPTATDGTGHLWIYLGGTIGPVPAGSTAGNYSAAITVTVTQ